MMTLTANQSVKKQKGAYDLTPSNPRPRTHSCQLRLLCKTQGRDEWTRPLSQSNLTKHWELRMSETNLQLSIKWKWQVGLFHATVKIVCSPNSLEALKEGVWMLNLRPCLFLDRLHYKTKTNWGKYFLINMELKRKPQESNSQCQQDPRERKCLHIKCFLCNPSEKNKETQNKEKRLSHHCLPIIQFKNTEPIM